MSTVKSSSANLTLNADGSGNDIKFQSNAVEKASISDAGLFSTTTVTATGVVTGATVEATGDTSAGDNAAIGYTATEGLILTGQGSTNDVTIKNDADATVLEVATGGVDVELTAGNLVIGTSGKGIDFSATSDTAGMTSEILDDYEEGTWTPTDGSTTGLTLTVSYARYRKIGSQVFCDFDITYPSQSDSQQAKITLPFPPASGTHGSGIVGYGTNDRPVKMHVNAYCYFMDCGTAAGNIHISNSQLSAKRMMGGWNYEV